MDWNSIIINTTYALIACVGFSLVFNLRGLTIPAASFGGAIGWFVYLTAGSVQSDLLRFFLATVAITVYAELMARIMRTPVTAFLVISLLPLVPGSGIYYTMSHLINGQTDQFIETGLHTIAIAGALAVGILPVFTLVRLYGRIKNQRKLFLHRGN